MTSDAVPATGDVDEDVDAVTSAVLTASRLLVAVSARSLAAAEEQVTLPQFRMLVVLASRPESKLATLAEVLAVNPSTALRMVDRLSSAGLLTRRVNPANRREVVLRLTPAGRQVVDDVTARRREEIARIVQQMAPRQRAGLVRALRAFTEAGGEPPADQTRDLVPLGWE
ncbi:MAG: MarR family winged helix-turn-helix transcriptional regulator [Micromonosporaceae bacterium]